MTAVLAGLIVVPGTSAQPGSQPFVFYGEEPWGGSYLGVDTRDVTSDRLSELHLKEERGVEVTMVDQDAPAGKAGIKEHDVILSINDQPVESVEQLRRMIREIPAGRTISIGISRDGQPVTLKAQLAERSKIAHMDRDFKFVVPPVNVPPINIPAINMPEMEFQNIVVIHSPVRSGLMVENLTPQLGDFFGVKSGNGVLVRSVEKGSRAEQAGFRAGDVITKVNGSPVNDCSDFTRLLRRRTENKASITVMRDRKEQTLTLTLPEPKRSGSLRHINHCDDLEDVACAAIVDQDPEIAELQAELATAGIKRLVPEMERAQKELGKEFLNHREELKKEMEKVQEELHQQQEELRQERHRWKGEAGI